MLEITIGHDAELFLSNKSGEAVPACGLIGGTKERPLPVEFGALQEDNVMAELNIVPAKTATEFLYNTTEVMISLKKIIQKYNLSILQGISGIKFEKGLHQKYPQVNIMGCVPEYNAYTGLAIDSPGETLAKTLQRYCAGHIHIGIYDDQEGGFVLNNIPYGKPRFVQLCDVVIGTAATLWGDSLERKQYYGAAGSYRITPYGVEYRVPDNTWLWSTETILRVFEVTRTVALLARSAAIFEEYYEHITNVFDKDLIINTINTGNKQVATEIQKFVAVL